RRGCEMFNIYTVTRSCRVAKKPFSKYFPMASYLSIAGDIHEQNAYIASDKFLQPMGLELYVQAMMLRSSKTCSCIRVGSTKIQRLCIFGGSVTGAAAVFKDRSNIVFNHQFPEKTARRNITKKSSHTLNNPDPFPNNKNFALNARKEKLHFSIISSRYMTIGNIFMLKSSQFMNSLCNLERKGPPLKHASSMRRVVYESGIRKGYFYRDIACQLLIMAMQKRN
ncbi:hypothetical protein HAX54_022207, partial [Datura stramonium]|nr:hypothetical protein [Datura stramonium]